MGSIKGTRMKWNEVCELDTLSFQTQPLDVLCQQTVAAVACEDWSLAELHQVMQGAWLYRDLDLETFTQVVYMIADGFDTRRGRRGAYIHFDAIHGMLRARAPGVVAPHSARVLAFRASLLRPLLHGGNVIRNFTSKCCLPSLSARPAILRE